MAFPVLLPTRWYEPLLSAPNMQGFVVAESGHLLLSSSTRVVAVDGPASVVLGTVGEPSAVAVQVVVGLVDGEVVDVTASVVNATLVLLEVMAG